MKTTLTRMVGVVVVAVLIGTAGGVWETAMIKRYEAVEGKSWQLFQTPNGAHYRRASIELPLVTTVIALIVYAIIATRIVRKWGTAPLVSLWVSVIVVGAGVWCYSALLALNPEGVFI